MSRETRRRKVASSVTGEGGMPIPFRFAKMRSSMKFFDGGTASTGACTAAYQTYDLDAPTDLTNPCSWHYGLTSADCGVTSEFGTSHEGDHVFAGIVGTYIHGYDGRSNEDPSVEVWVR